MVAELISVETSATNINMDTNDYLDKYIDNINKDESLDSLQKKNMIEKITELKNKKENPEKTYKNIENEEIPEKDNTYNNNNDSQPTKIPNNLNLPTTPITPTVIGNLPTPIPTLHSGTQPLSHQNPPYSQHIPHTSQVLYPNIHSQPSYNLLTPQVRRDLLPDLNKKPVLMSPSIPQNHIPGIQSHHTINPSINQQGSATYLDISPKITKLNTKLEFSANNFDYWSDEFLGLMAMGGLDRHIALELLATDSTLQTWPLFLHSRSNAQLTLIITNSVDHSGGFYPHLRTFLTSSIANSAILAYQYLAHYVQTHSNTDLQVNLNKLQQMKFTSGKLTTYTDEYQKLINILLRSKRFIFDTARKINFMDSLGNHSFTLQTKYEVERKDIETLTITEIAHIALKHFIIEFPSGELPVSPSLRQLNSTQPSANPNSVPNTAGRGRNNRSFKRVCRKCGQFHKYRECPAFSHLCRCGVRGHFDAQCPNSQIMRSQVNHLGYGYPTPPMQYYQPQPPPHVPYNINMMPHFNPTYFPPTYHPPVPQHYPPTYSNPTSNPTHNTPSNTPPTPHTTTNTINALMNASNIDGSPKLQQLWVKNHLLLHNLPSKMDNPARTFSIIPISPNVTLLLDTGAGISVTNNRNILTHLQPFSLKVGCAKDRVHVNITEVGILRLKLHCGIINILCYVSPDVTSTLISSEDIRLAGCDICYLAKGPVFIRKGNLIHNLTPTSQALSQQIVAYSSLDTVSRPNINLKRVKPILLNIIWLDEHTRLAHCSKNDLKRTFQTDKIDFSCKQCILANSILGTFKKTPYDKKLFIETDILYADYKVFSPRLYILFLYYNGWVQGFLQDNKQEDTYLNIQEFLLFFKKLFTIRVLVSDQDTPFKSASFKNKLLMDHNIITLPVPPLKHQLNRTELTIQHTMKNIRSVYFDTDIEIRNKYLANIIHYVCFVKNRLGNKQSPYYRFYGSIFNLQYLHRFFCDVFTIKLTRPNNLTPKAIPCKFLGYDSNLTIPSVLLYNPLTQRVLTRAFPDCYGWSDGANLVRIQKQDITIQDIIHYFSQRIDTGFVSYNSNDEQKTNINHFTRVDQQLLRSIKYGFDLVKLPIHLRNACFYAILQETSNIFRHDVMEEVSPTEIPSNATILPSQFIIEIKRSGKIRSRLVAAETKKYQDDDIITYSPTMNINLVYVLLAIRSYLRKSVVIFDFSSAFLYGLLKKQRYMRGAFPINHNTIFRIFGNLYGLSSASRTWFTLLSKVLKNFGFTQSKLDDCFFFIKNKIYLIVHVDDCLAVGSLADLQQLIRRLKLHFKLTADFTSHFDFLGLNIKVEPNRTLITQKDSILQKLDQLQITGFYDTPIRLNFHFSLVESIDISLKKPLQRFVGCLNHFTKSRIDICFAVASLSHTTAYPTKDFINCCIRVFQYLNKTHYFALVLNNVKSGSKLLFKLTTDASHRPDFPIGYLITLNDNIIDFKTKIIMETYSTSSLSEFVALSHGVKALKFYLNLFHDLEFFNIAQPIIAIDNKGVFDFLNKSGSTKGAGAWPYHFHQLKFWIRENCVVHLISGESNFADVLTKALSGPKLRTVTGNLFDTIFYKPTRS